MLLTRQRHTGQPYRRVLAMAWINPKSAIPDSVSHKDEAKKKSPEGSKGLADEDDGAT